MSAYLQLGPVTFQDFEMPAQVAFGGAQRLAVHVLPGGARVIDAMGRDDADVVWTGAFSGNDAADRARQIDLLRAEGGVQALAWDAFCYLVVIASFEASYQHVNWVPYRIACKVLADQTQPAFAPTAALAATLVADLTAATAINATAAIAAVSALGATSPGTAAYAAATSSLQGLSGQISSGMTGAGASLLAASDPAAAASAAGSLATLADAQGYVSRAGVNLGDIGL